MIPISTNFEEKIVLRAGWKHSGDLRCAAVLQDAHRNQYVHPQPGRGR